ncbi:patatin-like phospholipase family protein [Salipaludibacillus daqingensis]|uniref:patatin-like phospholipase family protein n=1 Tax=Salipaludibacillus daqingensis TaxID=3041001 RepID=UPI00247510F1|nr:patatin-like phospholipase family protein [Salipaludibacillus daqingensis]
MRPKIGLALGSGGSRGYAHIGILRVLADAKIPIDYISGSSMGALIGVLYGSGYSPELLEKLAIHFRRKYIFDFTVPKMGFIKGEKAKQFVKILVNDKLLEDLSPPVHVIATDLLKGERFVFTKGDIAQAVRASIAIPGIFMPEKIDGKLFVDGGVIDRVPVSVVKQMGADIVIAADVSYFNSTPEITSIYDVIMQSMDIMEKEMMTHRQKHLDYMIRPMLNQYNATQFTEAREIIERGKQEAEKAVPMILKLIDDWKGSNNEGSSETFK